MTRIPQRHPGIKNCLAYYAKKLQRWAIRGLRDSVQVVQYDRAVRQFQQDKRELFEERERVIEDLAHYLAKGGLKKGKERDFYLTERGIALSDKAVKWCRTQRPKLFQEFLRLQGSLDGAAGLSPLVDEASYREGWQEWNEYRQSVLELKPLQRNQFQYEDSEFEESEIEESDLQETADNEAATKASTEEILEPEAVASEQPQKTRKKQASQSPKRQSTKRRTSNRQKSTSKQANNDRQNQEAENADS